MLQWWNLSKSDEPLGIPYENAEFVKKFRSTFIAKILDIKKKLNISDPQVIVGKDCPRKTIWRHLLIEGYKGNRDTGKEFHGGPLFKMAYDTLFQEAKIHEVLSYATLEADDCIALRVEQILEKEPTSKIWIITSDMDYLQLASDNVQLFNLKFQDITKSKTAIGNAECDKFCKIVCGDKSDNIPGVFKKCGAKTALKYYNDRVAFEKKLDSSEHAREYLHRNTQLVDFKCIPSELRRGFFQDNPMGGVSDQHIALVSSLASCHMEQVHEN